MKSRSVDDNLMTTNTVLIGTSLGDNPVPRHFAALGRELTDSGYRVTLLVHGSIEDANCVDPRINVLHWPSPRPTQLADMLFFDRLVRRAKPCCVVSNFGAFAIMMTIGGLRRVPVSIHWYHTLQRQRETDHPGLCWTLCLRLMRLRAKIPFSFVTHAVANSNAAMQDLIGIYRVPAQKCRVFWNSLEDPKADSAPPPVAAVNRPSSRRFVCVGRFAPCKGQDILLKALVEVALTHPDTTVEFIGDGPERDSCEKLAGRLGVGKNCVFAGHLPHPDVLSRMAGAWATVVPSRTEAFGLVNIESMAVGIPVIGSNTGGIAEIVRDGVDGFLFPPGDHQALAESSAQLGFSDRVGQVVLP